MKKFFAIFLAVLFILGLTACGEESKKPETDTDAKRVIKLCGDTIEGCGGVTVEGKNAVITATGTYEVTGTLNDGTIAVNVMSGEVVLVLNGADIKCSDYSAIYVKAASDVKITLADGTENSVSDGSAYNYTDADEKADAAIYSRANLTIDGKGALNVKGSLNYGIVSNDTLTVNDGTLNVTSAVHGIKGKDNLIVNGGNIKVSAVTGDGLKSTNTKKADRGAVTINGGKLDITAADDGIYAVTKVDITGGEIAISTDNNGIKSEADVNVSGGVLAITTEDDGFVCANKNIGENAEVTVNGVEIGK